MQALQTAIATTSNNIANANTPGYAKESVDLTTAIPQVHGSASVGTGVQVTAILRSYSQAAANQLNGSQSNLGQLTSLQTYTNQVDNIVGTTAGGMSAALQSYYTAWSNVANEPTSIATRQASSVRGARRRVELSEHELAAADPQCEHQRRDHDGRPADQFDRRVDFQAEPANRRRHRASRRPAAERSDRSA